MSQSPVPLISEKVIYNKSFGVSFCGLNGLMFLMLTAQVEVLEMLIFPLPV